MIKYFSQIEYTKIISINKMYYHKNLMVHQNLMVANKNKHLHNNVDHNLEKGEPK